MTSTLTQALPTTSEQSYVTVHALSAGYLTLPEERFVQPSKGNVRLTVPSLSFLIQHYSSESDEPFRIVFDLGLRKVISDYAAAIREHITTRQPLTTIPDVKDNLALGDLKPEDIQVIILSHVHWDHVGTPSDFKSSSFVVGPGSIQLLQNGDDSSASGHAHFELNLLPLGRTIELPSLEHPWTSKESTDFKSRDPLSKLRHAQWQELLHFPHAIDVFSDGSLYIISAPGHLQGHVNVLARTSPTRWVYLGGDGCHDRRIYREEADIAEWPGPHGDMCSIHVDKKKTMESLRRVRKLCTMGDVEVIFAHDVEWANQPTSKACFWPGKI